MTLLVRLTVAVLALSTLGCGGEERSAPARTRAELPPAPAPAAPAETTERQAAAARPRIVFLGDSLTAGLGLAAHESVPALVQERLDKEGYDYQVVNAGVSGDTSAGGLSRLDW